MTLHRIFPRLLVFLFSLSFISCRPACPIEQCHVRMVHPHGEGEYRGVPIWKKQNLKYGEKLPRQKTKQVKNEKDKSKNKN